MVLERIGMPARMNPAAEECRRLSAAWMAARNGFGGAAVPSKVSAWNFADLGSAMYPDAVVQIPVWVANWTNWIAVVDDMVESDPEQIARMRRFLLDERDGVDRSLLGLIEGWDQLSRELTQGAPPEFRDRTRRALGELFDAYSWEVPYRSEGRLPPLAEFFEKRPATAGMPMYFLVLERSVGGSIEEEALSAPWLAELNQLVGNLACWANDLLTFRWDRDLGNPINLIRVTTGQRDLPAYEESLACFYDTWERMLAARAEVLRKAPPLAQAYVERLPEVASGVLVWMDRTRRYSGSA